MKSTYRTNLFQQIQNQLSHLENWQDALDASLRAEEMLSDVQEGRQYDGGYFVERLPLDDQSLDHRALRSDRPISGEDARHDLLLLIEDLTSAVEIPLDLAGQSVLTIEEVAESFNVSTKTISRWRKRGLAARWFLVDGRRRPGFLKSSIDRFAARNPQFVERGAQFSRVTAQERHNILELAREHIRHTADEAAGQGATIIPRIAQIAGRSEETVRQIIRQFDKEHPSQAVLSSTSGAMSPHVRQQIVRHFQRGVSLEALAEDFGRSEGQILRIIRAARYEQVMELPLEYMNSSEFEQADEERILAPLPAPEKPVRKARRPEGVPAYLASLYEVPLLTREQEQQLFRKYNYLKYRASQLRESLDAQRPLMRVMDEIEQLHQQAVEIKNQIIQANLRLVVSIAKKYAQNGEHLFKLVSDGNMSLFRAVEKFDYTLGNKFSTYATWAIRKNFSRDYSMRMRELSRYQGSSEEALADAPERREDPFQRERAQRQMEDDVKKILPCLTDRERRIVARRFGLEGNPEGATLKDIGDDLGVSKERIRQIEQRALLKLRQAAQKKKLETAA